MFIRLTRIDGQYVWFNSSYIVTVEPRKGYGSLVVPLGDGIDYEVCESPEKIVAAMGGEFAPDTTRKPSPKKAAATVLPPPGPAVSASASYDTPDFRVSQSAAPVPFELRNVPAETAPAEQPKKTVRRKRTAAKGEEKATGVDAASAAGGDAAPKKKAVRNTAARKPKLPPLPLTDEKLVRLQKMAPGSTKKLENTLKTQFAIGDLESAITSLVANGLIEIADNGRILWQWRTL